MAALKAESKNPDVRAALAELDRRRAELREQFKPLHAQRLKMKDANVVAVEPRPAVSAAGDVEQMFRIGKVVALVRPTEGERLWEIERECDLITAAIEYGGKEEWRLRVANRIELMGDVAALWNANITKTAKTVLLLRELASERASLRNEHAVRAGLAFDLPCGVQADRVVDVYRSADAAQAFLEMARKFNLI